MTSNILSTRRWARPAAGALTLALTLALSSPALAGPGHDHGDAPATPNANGPQRQPDGSVFLPKPAQRQLGVRTLLTEAAELPRSFELNGKVVIDPNAGGKVQPLNAGRIEPGPRGLPNAGQAVRKGEVLAYVVPSAAPIERSNQAAQLAELRAAKSLADKRVARLKELADTVPRKDIEAAESEAQSLAERIAAVGTGLASREALVAPVSGVIASAHVVAGQVVDARELLFEIVDPARLRIEALAFDAALAGNVGSASLAVGNQRVPLAFIGAARSLREQALPLGFRAEGKVLSSLAVGQPVRVFVQGKEKVQGVAVPVSSLMKNPANQTIVWVKTAPERFEPRTVTVEPLDGVNVAVTSGLKAGDRVATQGATLINQVR
ncbi:efflux RND transporter periplasmic adaptor subunit [Rubrivivax albus]|uniref:HlyD family efflux transporter periplasmic adaptor subunit n=1 Tax=Rubrivivax albus TaxID=2499835 RepID=A0A3S2TQ30_9BURK|nr:HlyD family efflux transporter periplasmic adaptor subunit [Rubrivivax albus]RVT50576.1 HlyD family efflux transporter periplasmic adaptor subunit [Rubrivivax albus]